MWLNEYTLNECNFNYPGEKERVEDFLKGLSLKLDKDVEYTLIIERKGKIIASGSIAGKVLKNIGVDAEFQGQGLSAKIVGELIKEQLRRNRGHLFIYTKPEMAYNFFDLGFEQIAVAQPYVALLEWGSGSIYKYLDKIRSHAMFNKAKDIGALVVNCNPFTLGHQYLIERASKECEAVYLIVVSEDRSLFPLGTRMRLIKEGTKHLKNVQVIEGKDYVISSATFPAYFTREENLVKAQTLLDIEIFNRYFVPALGIKRRYVGEEPFCKVTNEYNITMEIELPKRGVTLCKIPRKDIEDKIISASLVRQKIKKGDWEGIKKLVPITTYEFLISPEGKAIVEKIKESKTRH